jgi:predicted phage replisome organizer
MAESKSSFGKVKWIKLDPDVFNDEKIQLIESLPDGDTILILWFKLLALCGKANHGGLVTYVTLDSIKPYTDDMLVTLWKRKKSTVLLALDTFEQFGMIERLDNDAILVVNWEKYQNIAGLEQIREQNRLRKQKQRDREKQKLLEYKDTNMSRDMSRDVTQQNKNKKENKDILKEKDKKEKTVAKRSPSFVKPTREEILDYCKERQNQVNPSQFYDFYESKNWMVGKNKMKDWKAAVRTWEQRNKSNGIKISTRPDVKPDWLEEYIQENGGN